MKTEFWLRECHPEVSCAVLAGQPLKHPKKPARGDVQRLGELERVALLTAFHVDIGSERARLGARVGRDDIVDALACLVTAYRRLNKEEMVLPRGHEQLDDHGLRAEIVS